MTAVLVTRPSAEATALVSALRASALRVHAVPTIELAPVPLASAAGRRLRAALLDLGPTDWVVVTSRLGASVVARSVALDDGLSYLPLRWAAVGPAAAQTLAGIGIVADATAPPAQHPSLIWAMAAHGSLTGRRVVVARSDVADAGLPRSLAAAGALVQVVATHRTIEGPEWARSTLREAVSDPDLGMIVVASGSAARGLIRMVDGDTDASRVGGERLAQRARDLPTITIGPATTTAARVAGLRVVAEAETPTVAGIVSAVRTALRGPDPAGSAPSGVPDR